MYVCVKHSNGDEGKVILMSDFVAVCADFECLNFCVSGGESWVWSTSVAVLKVVSDFDFESCLHGLIFEQIFSLFYSNKSLHIFISL